MPFDRDQMIKDLVRDGVTAVYAYVQHFTDANLRTMKSFIEEEIERRKKVTL
jgi:hypothetical protein